MNEYLTLSELAERWDCSLERAVLKLSSLGMLRLEHNYTGEPYRFVLTSEGYECSSPLDGIIQWDIGVLERLMKPWTSG